MLSFEQLENRNLLASVALNGGDLNIIGDTYLANKIQVDTVNNQTQVYLNGTISTFDGVTKVNVIGGERPDIIGNNTSLPSTMIGNGGNDSIQGAGGNDVIIGGAGQDIIYDLLGTNFIDVKFGWKDTVFTNPTTFVNKDLVDQQVTFFDNGLTPGSGKFELRGNVLYITPPNNGSTVSIDFDVNGDVVLSYDFNDGKPGTQTYPKAAVGYISYFGGAGNDRYTNNTTINEAAYGSAGNDTLVGGMGTFSILKGSSGDDTVVGRAKNVDMTGNSGKDVLVGNGYTIFRADSTDVLINLDQWDAALIVN